MTFNPNSTVVSTTVVAVLAAISLAACDPKPKTSEKTAGQQVDSAIAKVEEKAAEVKADAEDATADMRARTSPSTQAVTGFFSDAAITTAVNAKLAADSGLSALRINVDTVGGQVALSGDAPDAAARDRATALVRSVDGVTNVDNRLTLQKKG